MAEISIGLDCKSLVGLKRPQVVGCVVRRSALGRWSPRVCLASRPIGLGECFQPEGDPWQKNQQWQRRPIRYNVNQSKRRERAPCDTVRRWTKHGTRHGSDRSCSPRWLPRGIPCIYRSRLSSAHSPVEACCLFPTGGRCGFYQAITSLWIARAGPSWSRKKPPGPQQHGRTHEQKPSF